MSEQRAPTTCPTCGVPCRLISDPDGESTSYYEPIADLTVELQAARDTIAQLEAQREQERRVLRAISSPVRSSVVALAWNMRMAALAALEGVVPGENDPLAALEGR